MLKTCVVLLCLCCPYALASKPAPQCSRYLLPVEQDGTTMNLQMAGMNANQKDWYRKHGIDKDNGGVCIADPDKTGNRVPIKDGKEDPEDYLGKIVGALPLYMLMWEQHQIFVPDKTGGHYAWSANGILYRMNTSGDGGLDPIGPVHDTNKTVFSSSSLSLLKAAIKQIKSIREAQ